MDLNPASTPNPSPEADFCAGTSGQVSEVERAPVNVLIVDDEAIFAKILQMSLERDRRFVADVAFCGREALRMLENNRYNLVISDVRMAEGSGLELFAWIQRHQPQLAKRFLFITGDIANLKISDPNTPVLRKPFKIDDLTSRCAQIISAAA